MEIITFSATKGGVGKTTLTYNFGEWLADKGNNVLLIDSDHQCSLSQTYEIFKTSGTLAEIFTNNGDNVEIEHIKDNLSLITASMDLDKINNAIQNKANKELIFYMWLADNYDELKVFDYILIDCHPDFSTITQNMIAVSDKVFSPLEPSEYSFISKSNLELRFDDFKKEIISVETRKSLVTAELYFLGNRIKHNTKSSREFVPTLKSDPNVIVLIPEKELFNKSTLNHMSLVDMKKNKEIYRKHKQFFDDLDITFEIMSMT